MCDQKYTFIFQGVEYDATDYIDKHPGGILMIKNMKAQRKDFTEYFKSLHSKNAEIILKSFPVLSQGSASSESQQYYTILRKVQHFYKPIWSIEILLILLVSLTFWIALTTHIPFISILCFAFTQTIVGWIGHSAGHSRDKWCIFVGSKVITLFGGFYLNWWNPKHEMHHIFTNSQLYDQDIQHEYKMILYPFLYLKWRFDSFISALTTIQFDFILIVLNYAILFYFYQNLIYFVLGELIAGFYSANLLIGNHEREKRYNKPVNQAFIDHQLSTSRDYNQDSFLWILIMGGMQFQAEHHLFPQIPFYRLSMAVPIIRQQLVKINKKIIFGTVL